MQLNKHRLQEIRDHLPFFSSRVGLSREVLCLPNHAAAANRIASSILRRRESVLTSHSICNMASNNGCESSAAMIQSWHLRYFLAIRFAATMHPLAQRNLLLVVFLPLRLTLLSIIVIGYAIISRLLLGDVAYRAKSVPSKVCGLRQWLHRQLGKIASRSLLLVLGFFFIEEKGKRHVSFPAV
jgi:hypothetical protein